MKYFIAIILMSLLLASCKAPMNSINDKSFPEESQFVNITNTLDFKMIEEHYNKKYIDVKIKLEESDTLNSLYFSLVEDTLNFVRLSFSLNEQYYACFQVFRRLVEYGKNEETYMKSSGVALEVGEAQYIFKKKQEERYPSPEPIVFWNSIHPISPKFHKKGITYETIMDTLHQTIYAHLKDKYTRFYNDTVNQVNAYSYSISFNTYKYGGGLPNDLEFLPLTIAYYSHFPEKMENWQPSRKINMKFLIDHYFDSIETIDSLRIESMMDNQVKNGILLTLLSLIKNPDDSKFFSGEKYMEIIYYFRNHSDFRWIDDSLIDFDKKIGGEKPMPSWY